MSPLSIGSIELPNRLFVAPMAGVTDRPFRVLCKKLGAGYAVSEMVTSRRDLWDSLKTSRRADHAGEPAPIAVQIAGTEPIMMAEAAAYNIDRGAQIIDINMGCPAKKVCNVWAGSALMRDAPLALRIVEAVVTACTPRGDRVVLGLAAVKAAVGVPVVANGDIDSPAKAREVLRATGCDAVMVGRAAQGRPWIFREIAHFLATGAQPPAPRTLEAKAWLLEHLRDHYGLYGEFTGVRSARKHIGWAVRALPGGERFRARMNTLESAEAQFAALADFFDALAVEHERLPDGGAPEDLSLREAA